MLSGKDDEAAEARVSPGEHALDPVWTDVSRVGGPAGVILLCIRPFWTAVTGSLTKVRALSHYAASRGSSLNSSWSAGSAGFVGLSGRRMVTVAAMSRMAPRPMASRPRLPFWSQIAG